MVIALSIIANPNNWVAVPALAATNGPSLYQSGGRHRTISAALALGSVGIVVAGLMTALVAPEIMTPAAGPLITYNDPLPVPPEPDPQPQPDPTRHDSVLTSPRPKLDIPIASEGPTIVDPIDFTIPPLGGVGSGGGTGDVSEIITPPPIFTAAHLHRRAPQPALCGQLSAALSGGTGTRKGDGPLSGQRHYRAIGPGERGARYGLHRPSLFPRHTESGAESLAV